MDPRLKPSLSPHRPNMAQDVTAPNSQPQVAPVQHPTAAQPSAPHPVAAQPTPPPIAVQPVPTTNSNYELVGSIPMAQPGAAPVAAPTADAGSSSLGHPQAQQSDDDFDKILQAVNNRVQAPIKPVPKARSQTLSKLTAKVPKVKSANKSTRPIGAMVAVVAIVLLLSVVAFMAYKQGSKGTLLSSQASQVGTSSQAAASIQAAGGKLVSPGDLDDYSQDLAKQLNSLNDSQDFSPNALSNSVLGL